MDLRSIAYRKFPVENEDFCPKDDIRGEWLWQIYF